MHASIVHTSNLPRTNLSISETSELTIYFDEQIIRRLKIVAIATWQMYHVTVTARTDIISIDSVTA